MAETSTDIDTAIEHAKLTKTDKRGLMPVTEARREVKAAETFAGGEADDRLWAALLSLKDAKEFVRNAKRIRWEGEPASGTVLAAFDRFGDDLLPWIETAVDNGALEARPAFLPELLLEIGTHEAFRLVYELESVDGSAREAAMLLREWVEVHPDLGYAQLADRAELGEPRARKVFRHLANLDPRAAFEHVALSRGEEDTEALFTALCIVRHLTEASVLSVLDLSAEREMDAPEPQWPMFHWDATPAMIYHGMRLVAVRQRDGNDWGIVMERIGGASPETAVVEPYAYGPNVVPGLASDAVRQIELEVDWPSGDERPEGASVTGTEGRLALTDKLVAKLGLKQRGLGSLDAKEQAFVIGLRAYFAQHPKAFWIAPEKAAEVCKVRGAFDVVMVSYAHTHVLGTVNDVVTRRDKFWQVRPSDTRVFRSLARALVERDPDVFRPGKSNLDWREHPLPRNLAFEPV